ncbi:MAG: helix-turn-helix transcriptional regulator [Nitrososphaerota archaeon]|nr:helix-turn-helix transcriptional regulator [Nitrososphaerota archaeon]
MVTITDSAIVRLLQFLRAEQWANAVVRYCEREGVSSRATTFKLLKSLEEEGSIQSRKEGQRVLYRITEEGERRIKVDQELNLGKFPPTKVRLWQAETKITAVPESIPPVIKSKLKRIMADANLSRELGTLTGTAMLAYAMSFEGRPSLKSLAEKTGAGFSGGFTDSGRFDMMVVLGIERSNQIRKLLDSGKFEGVTGLVNLIFETGYRGVLNAFEALRDSKPQEKTMSVTLMPLSTVGGKIQRETMDPDEIAVKFVREIAKSRPEILSKASHDLKIGTKGWGGARVAQDEG